MARLIDGKEIAESIYENINLRARELRGRGVMLPFEPCIMLQSKTMTVPGSPTGAMMP